MAYNELLADRIRQILKEKSVYYIENKMMGGLSFLVDNKMCVGIIKNMFVARVHPEIYEECLLKEGCSEMSFNGRPVRGFLFVSPDVVDMDEDLESWVQVCLDYNPFAKASKRSK